jgi:hypothetical protein
MRPRWLQISTPSSVVSSVRAKTSEEARAAASALMSCWTETKCVIFPPASRTGEMFHSSR